MLTRSVVAVLALGFLQVFAPAMAHAAGSQIDKRYSSDPALAQLLGAPTSTETSIAAGRVRRYQHGALYWSGSAGVHEVHGSILVRYDALGGPALHGFPTTDEQPVFDKLPGHVDGAASDFEKGELVYTTATGKVNFLGTAIAKKWNRQPYPYLGMPISDERASVNGQAVEFYGGFIYAGPNGAIRVDRGAEPRGSSNMADKYRALGLDRGLLNIPWTDAAYVPATATHVPGHVQVFWGGRLYQRGAYFGSAGYDPHAYEVHGAILGRYLADGGVDRYGFPTSDELVVSTGRVSHFEKGSIYWSSITGQISVTATY